MVKPRDGWAVRKEMMLTAREAAGAALAMENKLPRALDFYMDFVIAISNV
jgi:hypothetical protein